MEYCLQIVFTVYYNEDFDNILQIMLHHLEGLSIKSLMCKCQVTSKITANQECICMYKLAVLVKKKKVHLSLPGFEAL